MSNVAWRMGEHASKKAKEAAQEFAQSNDGADAYKVITNVRVVRKAPKEFFGLPARVVSGFLKSKGFLHSTNEQIAETVSNWIPHYPLPANFMDKPLSPKQLASIGDMMARAGLMFDRKAHKSLSRIKFVIQAGKAAADAHHTFTGSISFGTDCVTVGAKRFPFTTDANGYKRIKVGSQKLRVDVLQSLFEAGHLPSSTK